MMKLLAWSETLMSSDQALHPRHRSPCMLWRQRVRAQGGRVAATPGTPHKPKPSPADILSSRPMSARFAMQGTLRIWGAARTTRHLWCPPLAVREVYLMAEMSEMEKSVSPLRRAVSMFRG